MLHIGLAIDDLGVHGAVRRMVELGNALTARGHWVTLYTQDGKLCAWLPQQAEPATFADMAGAWLDGLVFSAGLDEAHAAARKVQARVKVYYILNVPRAEVLKNTDAYTQRVNALLKSPEWQVAACSTALAALLRAHVRPDAFALIGGINRTIFHRRKVERTTKSAIILSSGDSREREGTAEVLAAVKALSITRDVMLNTYFRKGYSQSQMAECYSGADVFLDAQHYAGWNNAVAEAMACGCPVVCTDIGGSRDLAVPDVTALVVDVCDVQAMVKNVARLLDDQGLRERLVRNALERVAEYTYSRMAEQLEDIVNGQISG